MTEQQLPTVWHINYYNDQGDHLFHLVLAEVGEDAAIQKARDLGKDADWFTVTEEEHHYGYRVSQ